jgi:hypothetical protein
LPNFFFLLLPKNFFLPKIFTGLCTHMHTYTHTCIHTCTCIHKCRMARRSVSLTRARALSLSLSLTNTHTHTRPDQAQKCIVERNRACA